MTCGQLKPPPPTPDEVTNEEAMENLDRRVLMTRVLGLPGCCLERGLLQYQELNGWTPTDEMLLDECKRRLVMLGIPFRTLLVKLLMDNPVRDFQECNRLLLRLLDLEKEFQQTALLQGNGRTQTTHHQGDLLEKDETLAVIKMPSTNDREEKNYVRWSFGDLSSSPSLPTVATGTMGVNQGKNADADTASSTLPVTESEQSSSTTDSKSVGKAWDNSDSMSVSASVESEDDFMPSEESQSTSENGVVSLCNSTDDAEAELDTLYLIVSTTGSDEGQADAQDNKQFGQGSTGLARRPSQDQSSMWPPGSEIIPTSDDALLDDRQSFATVGSMDMSSTSSALMSMSLEANNSSQCSSSTHNPSTLGSSQDDSGLTADSKKQARIRGAGLPTLSEEGAVQPGRIVQVVGISKIRGLVASREEDNSTVMSGTSWSIFSIGKGEVSTVSLNEALIDDRSKRRGKYTGTCIRARAGRLLPHGKGVMVYDSGMTYDGDWCKGVWEGHGKLDHAPNNYYAGSFVRGRFSGEGLRRFPDGSEYEGGWEGGKASGKGTFRNDRGDVFDGPWVNNKLKGQGRVRFADGCQYKGMFVGGFRQGFCSYTDPYGKEHVGVWVSNRRVGKGHRYDGLWKNGKPHGFGKVRYSSGGFYEGSFVNGKKEGLGKILWPNGYEYEGHYKGDKANGKGKATYPDGSWYQGLFVNDQKNGYGKEWSPNGSEYRGEWKNNKRNGRGTYHYSHGFKYDGEWLNDQHHGHGCWTYPDGSVWHNGEWESNNHHNHNHNKAAASIHAHDLE